LQEAVGYQGKKEMADSYSRKLPIWEGWMPAMTQGPAPSPCVLPGPHYPAEFAEGLFAREVLTGPDRSRYRADPFSLQWFLDVENARFGRHGRWIPRLLEFAKHNGETLLGLGPGLGTDWVQYARHGAEVIVCCSSGDQLALVQRHFQLRSLRGVFHQARPSALPLESASIDVVCLTSLLQESSKPTADLEEVYRVLKPGGKVLAVAPTRYDIEFWCRRWLPWRRWLLANKRPPLPSPSFSARQLRQLLGRFVEHRIYKRHLRRSEVPHLWRWLPLPLLERALGHFLVIKAFKPLSAVNTLPLAA
jgi:ubiquinone/menaquinone biosynthesis C-methylase UbiE